MDKFLTLLDLQKRARDAANLQELGFVLVNNTHKLVHYTQGLFWTYAHGDCKLQTVSGNAAIEHKSVYALWMKDFIERTLKERQGTIIPCSVETILHADQEPWRNWCAAHALLVVFKTRKGIIGGLWLERATAFNDAEIHVLEELAQSYAQSLALLSADQNPVLSYNWKNLKRYQKYAWMMLGVACILPVRLSVTAPAELIAQGPAVLTVPYDGMLEEVSVRPGDVVSKDQVLARMDKTSLQAQMDMAAQNLQTANDALSRISREALKTPEKKTELNQVQSEIRTRKIDYDHAKILLERSELTAPKDGVAIFSDANVLEGRPVRTGEKVMLVANPKESELLIRVPVDAMIPLDQSKPVHFYLNVSPLSSYRAEIISIGYQASADPDGLLTYKIRAKLADNPENVRIGWKGTAKVQGGWSILSYAILRRPLITLRNITGL
jgi:hypothetical protein